MYIRRKVFSVILDEDGDERLFSTNEIINEDDYLDEVMYSDKMSTGEKVGLGVAGTGALAGAGLYGNRLYQLRKAAIEKAGGKEAWKALKAEQKKEYKEAILKGLEDKKWKDMKGAWGERGIKYGKKAGLAGAGLAAAGLAGYGISRYNRKQKNHSFYDDDDYLDEVMYSDMSTGEKVGLGVAGTGALAGAGLYGNRIYQLNKLAKADVGEEVWKGMKKEQKKAAREDVLKRLEGKKWKDMKGAWGERGAKYGKKAGYVGAGLAAAGLAGYGISRYNRKNK